MTIERWCLSISSFSPEKPGGWSLLLTSLWASSLWLITYNCCTIKCGSACQLLGCWRRTLWDLIELLNNQDWQAEQRNVPPNQLDTWLHDCLRCKSHQLGWSSWSSYTMMWEWEIVRAWRWVQHAVDVDSETHWIWCHIVYGNWVGAHTWREIWYDDDYDMMMMMVVLSRDCKLKSGWMPTFQYSWPYKSCSSDRFSSSPLLVAFCTALSISFDTIILTVFPAKC